MRKLVIAFFLLLPALAEAQQYPLYTQTNFNNFGDNPAFAGTSECADVMIGYRKQWAEFEGSPVTLFLNGHGKIEPKNSRKTSFWGVGGRVFNDEAGPFNSIQLELGGAYHVKISRKMFFSVGLFAGVINSRFNVAGLTLSNFGDPAINGSQASILGPSITPGFLLYNERFYMGFSIQNMIDLDIPDVGLQTRTARHYIFKVANAFTMSERSQIIPSVIIRYAYSAPVAYDINVIYRLDKKFELGVAYRNQNAIAALIQFKIFDMFSLGYSYDYTLNNIKYGTHGSHEIILRFKSCELGGNSPIAPCAAFN